VAAGTILTVLANIPWGAVLENAPKVAEGAAKLWSTVTRWNKSDSVQHDQTVALPQKPMSDSQLLASQVLALEDGVRQLNEQMQASSSLIKDLAEQNALLIQRVELNRIRLIRYSVTAISIATALLGLVLYLLFSR